MNSSIVAVDIGNTRIQCGVARGLAANGLPDWKFVEHCDTTSFAPQSFAAWTEREALSWRVASVHRPSERALAQWIREARPSDDYRRLSHTDLPLRVQLASPERVGVDRLAAAVAANRLRTPGTPAIVIDAGTAITVDAVDTEGSFLGGVIMPGMRMMLRSLATGTDLLPLVEAGFSIEPPEVLGRSTEGAIRSGVFWGAIGAIRHVVLRFQQDLGRGHVFVTGGDSAPLAGLLECKAVFVPNMVLAGILWSLSP